MNDKHKSYTEQFKKNQKKLKKRAKELFDTKLLPDEEPQFTGDPNKIFEEDDSDSKDNP